MSTKPLDLMIEGGILVDGLGSPRHRADVGIEGDRITRVGMLESAPRVRTIQADGAIVAPGFIDAHSHQDLSLFADPSAEHAVWQGVTTQVLGQDGVSCAPAPPDVARGMARYWAAVNGPGAPGPACRSVASFLGALDARVATNVAYLVPHGTIRCSVLGWDDRPPTDDEMRTMSEIVRVALEQGAVGLSTGLDYAPGAFATTTELIGLAGPLARVGGVYVTHVRGALVDGLAEAITIGREAGVPVHISHLKLGPANPSAEVVFKMIEEAIASGVDLTFDAYPYTSGNGPLYVLLPTGIFAGGPDACLERLADPTIEERLRDDAQMHAIAWSDIYLSGTRSEEFIPAIGTSIAQAATGSGSDPVGFVRRLLIADRLQTTIVNAGGSDDGVDAILSHPRCMVGTDGLPVGQLRHPRSFATFSRILARLTQQPGARSLEDGIRKMTWLPAERFGLNGRGAVREGMSADLVVLRPAEIRETPATPAVPFPPGGVQAVIVNGELVLDGSDRTAEHPGRALRRNRSTNKEAE